VLTHLRVRNYKSLRSLDLPLNRFQVLVGPNNAGKSNMLDVLRFLRDLVVQGHAATASRGSAGELLWNGDLKGTIRIEVEGCGDPVLGIPEAVLYRWHIEFAGRPDGNLVRVDEGFAVRWRPASKSGMQWYPPEFEKLVLTDDWIGLLALQSPGGKAVIRDLQGHEIAYSDQGPSGLIAVGDVDRNPIIAHFRNDLVRWQTLDFVPQMMRQPVPARRQMVPGQEGEEISAFLHTLHTEYPREFEAFVAGLRSAIPEIDALLTALTESGKTHLKFSERGLKLNINPWMMSQGTLRILAHLAVLNTPTPPSLMTFEEPENFVHPRLAELVANSMKQASKRFQMILSTHSTHIVDAMAPEDLIVVEKRDGATVATRPTDNPGMVEALRESLRTLGLGEVWFSGNLGGVP